MANDNLKIEMSPDEAQNLAGILGMPTNPGDLPTPPITASQPAPPPGAGLASQPEATIPDSASKYLPVAGAMAAPSPQPTAAGANLSPAQIALSSDAKPLPSWMSATPAAAGLPGIGSPSPLPDTGTALGQIPTGTQTQPTKQGATPLTTKQKILGTLGKIGGYGLMAMAPGYAAMIPQTPIGRIAAQQRGMEQTKLEQAAELQRAQIEDAKTKNLLAQRTADIEQQKLDLMKGSTTFTMPNGQTVTVPNPDFAKAIGPLITAQGGIVKTGMQGQTQRDVTEIRVQGQRDVAHTRATSAEQIAADNNLTREDINNKRMINAVQLRNLQDETMQIVANERIQAQNDPDKLTVAMKNMKQQAKATLPRLEAAINETDKVADLLGPGAGRWNDFWQGKVGMSGPNLTKFAHYKDEIAFVSSAVTLAHARGRISNELFDHFKAMFDAGHQSADNMKAALDVADEWLTDYANLGEGGGTAPAATGGGAKASGGGTAGAPKTGGVTAMTVPVGGVYNGYKYLGGDRNQQSSWEKQ